MKNGLFKKWLAAALCVLALGSTAALAEPDSFGLGSGRNGALTVTTAGTVVNSYAPATAPLAAGDTTVLVGTPIGAPTGFAAGDLVMVLQTTGIVPVPGSGGTTPIDLTNDAVGRWEFARLASVSGSTLTLTAALIHSYAANVTQVIRVPEYTTVTLTGPGRLVATPWNGSAGGVVAFLATGTVSNAGQINANLAGFRGGQYVDDDSGTLGCTGLDEAPPSGAQKGEGIANVRYGATQGGRGNVANGAGGGVCYKSGGGGGGNSGAGGVGGRSESSADGERLVGGQGGSALTYDLRNHITFGGGGGAGHGADSSGVAGGRGGGIVFIRANQLTGTGSIAASGGSAGLANSDAGSGGGAGGSVYLRFASTAACGSVNVAGGVGGNSGAELVGPGGGGGGGRVLFQAASGATCTASSGGGSPGVQQKSDATDGAAYGAKAGSNGNVTSLTGGLVVPAVPTVTTPANNSFTNNPQPNITGTAQPNTTVVIYIDGVEVGRATSNSAGNYIFPLPVPLAAGPHTVSAATEVDAIQSARSAANTFTIDTTPPAAPVVVAPANGSYVTTVRPPITGTAEANSTVTVYIDGVVAGTTTANASGAWSFTPTTDLSQGSHTAKATSRDAAGNVSVDSNTNTFTVDSVVPAAPVVVAPGNGSYVTTVRPPITGTAEANSTVTVYIDGVVAGTTTADASGAWSFTPTTDLSQGSHTAKATSRDAAGNVSVDSNTSTFTVDTVVPAAPVVVAPGNNSYVTTLTPTFTGTAEANSTVSVYIDGVFSGTTTADASGNWSYTPTTPLIGQDAHQVYATATDAAGNASVESNTNTFIVDSVKPVAPTVDAPAEGAYVTTVRPVITGTAEAGTTVKVYIDGVEVGTTTADASGNWSYTPTTDLTQGSHNVKVTSTDAAGNVSVDSNVRTFIVDSIAPVAPVVLTPENGAVEASRPTFTGTAEPGATVTIIVDGVEVGTTTADASGNWSYTIPAGSPGLTDGSHSVTAKQTDAAGNTGPVAVPENEFTVDGTLPSTTIETKPPLVSNSTTAEFTFSSDKSPVTYECTLDGALVSCTAALKLENLAEGSHTLTVRAVDELGHKDPSPETYTWTVDTVAPAAPVVVAPAEGSEQTTSTPVISGTAEPGSTVTVIIDGVEVGTTTTDASGNWSFPTTTPLTPGPHEVTARATDAAGNTSPDSAPSGFTVVDDTPAPVLPAPVISSGPSGSTPEHGATFEFGSDTPGVTYECSLDGATYTACTSPTSYDNLADGEHTFRVRTRDTDGNVSEPATRAWTVSTPPAVGEDDVAFLGGGVGCSASGGDASLVMLSLGTLVTLARRRRRQG